MDDGSWVGLDAHARKVVAGLLDGASGELRVLRVPWRSAETVRWLAALPRPVRAAYEAGPTGFDLARLLRLGELTAVRVPSPPEEAARDLVRAREDVRSDLMRARHRLSKLLLRHGLICEGSAWTGAHDAWLRRQRFERRPLTLAWTPGSPATTPSGPTRAWA